MAGRIYDIDFYAIVINRGIFRHDGDAALFFQIQRIHHAVLDGLINSKYSCLLQHGVKQRGFAVIDMGNYGNIPYMIFFHHSKFLQVIFF